MLKAVAVPSQDSWCFIDESWQRSTGEEIGVLAAVICSWETHEALACEMHRVRRKYYSETNARDSLRELKGKELLNNNSFKHATDGGFSKNQMVAREILEFALQTDLRVVVGVVYGETRPPLLSPDPKLLAPPFRELCNRVLAHLPDHSRGHLVCDQRLGAQEAISISIHNYLAGLPQPHRIRTIPLIAVSNVCAGLQLADIAAYIVGRYSIGDDRFQPWYQRIKRLQIECVNHRGQKVYGLYRQQWHGGENYTRRATRTKKEELGSSGKEEC